MSARPITRETMFEPMLAAIPSFRRQWDKFLTDWTDTSEPPLYIALGDLADHLADKLEQGDTKDFDRVFEVVERWHIAGDDYVREAATVGLLEGLQQTLQHRESRRSGQEGVCEADIEPWLGPKSRKWWDKLYHFWDGDPTALQDTD